MYQRILVALENGPADRTLLPHIAQLAARLGAELVLLHVADGWAARHFQALKLAESEEIVADRRYLESTASSLKSQGLTVQHRLAMGDPATEILKTATAERCDLIAMATHGHRLLGDLVFGSTISEVRHAAPMPVLLVRAGS
jgi:manganese transport protein